MSVARYSFINAKIRGLKADILSQEQWDALLGARDMYSALRILDATGYSEIAKQFDENAMPIEIGQALRLDFNRVLTEIRNDVPKSTQPLMNWIIRKFQREVVKPLLRLYMTQSNHDTATRLLVPITPFSMDEIAKLLGAKDLTELVSSLPDPYFKHLLQEILPQYKETQRFENIEQTIDGVILENLFKQAKQMDGQDREITSQLVGIEIDLINLMTTLRTQFLGITAADAAKLLLRVEHRLPLKLCREALQSRNFQERVQKLQQSYYGAIIAKSMEAYEQYQNLYVFEHAFHKQIRVESTNALLGYPFHFGILLGYLNLKWYETLNLKALMNGKADHLEPHLIQRVLIL